MALHLLLALVMSKLLPRLQSTRVKHDIAGEIQTSGHSDRAVVDEKLLTCVVGKTKSKIIIQFDDQPFWEYYYTKEVYYTSYPSGTNVSFNCKTYTPPLKAAYALRSLTTPRLSEDMIGSIASFNASPERCRPCNVLTFRPKFLDKCSASSIEGGSLEEQRQRFKKVSNEVYKEGGSCHSHSASAKALTLQSCMRVAEAEVAYPKGDRRFAACYALRE